jgi:hypothetical protein
MELPTNTLPTSPRELAQLAKEQTLGEAKYLGCPRVEAPNSITKAVSSGPTKISGKTAISKGSQTATIPRGPATALPTTISNG